jgi:hypothetical protein
MLENHEGSQVGRDAWHHVWLWASKDQLDRWSNADFALGRLKLSQKNISIGINSAITICALMIVSGCFPQSTPTTSDTPILTKIWGGISATSTIKGTEKPATTDMKSLFASATLMASLSVQTKIPDLKTSCDPGNTNIESCIRQLMKNNHGCKFPCWWGIDPGYTKLAEADNLIKGFVSQNNPFGVQDKIINKISYGLDVDEATIEATMRINDNYINVIKLRADITDENKIDEFHELFKEYLPREIFRQFGKPSRVYLAPGPGLEWYLFQIVYDTENFMINYSGNGIIRDNSSKSICPEMWNSKLNMYAISFASKSKDVPGKVEEIYSQSTTQGLLNNLAIETFYNALLDNENACLKIDSSQYVDNIE